MIQLTWYDSDTADSENYVGDDQMSFEPTEEWSEQELSGEAPEEATHVRVEIYRGLDIPDNEEGTVFVYGPKFLKVE